MYFCEQKQSPSPAQNRLIEYEQERQAPMIYNPNNIYLLTVRFLVSCSGTTTTELLWLHSSGVSNQQVSVVSSVDLLQFVLRSLINVLSSICNQSLGQSLSDSVNLGDMTTTGNSDSNVQVGKLVQTNQKDWLVDFVSQNLWLDQSNWSTINLDKTSSGLNVNNSSCVLLFTKSLKNSQVCQQQLLGNSSTNEKHFCAGSIASHIRFNIIHHSSELTHT